MKKNIGTMDRNIRIAVAVIIAILYLAHVITGVLAIVLSAAAVVFLLTAVLGVCPLYLPFGINTCKKN